MNKNYIFNGYENKKKKGMINTFAKVAIGIFLIYICFIFVQVISFNNHMINGENQKDNSNNEILEANTNVNSSSVVELRVTPQMNFIFRTHYEKDDNTIEERRRPGSYDVNLTINELKKIYCEWNILNSNENEIVFYKSVLSEAPNYYVIGEKDGFMAVYYEHPELGLRLREVTEREIASFELQEQDKLRIGIKVYGEENLIKLLEDYSSWYD